ncbi:MAG: hypothetical protein QF704_16505, partial [Anaerolineales bacterium]|nr:hypothetical protein [Anaerolineales bacterium]
MATLTGQSIASSYEQLLHVDADGGGNSTTHVSVKDGDNGTTFGFTIASDALMMSSTNRLEFGDTGTYINQSGDGILNITSDTEGGGDTTTLVPIKDGDNDTTFCLQLSTTKAMIEGNGSTLYFYDEGGESISADNAGVLSIAAGAEIDLTATAIDLNGTLDVSGTLTQGGASQFNSTITVGEDDTGYDVIFYGNTASSNMTWDTSEDDLVINDSRLFVDQDDNVDSIVVDTEATSAHGLTIAGDALTTGSAAVFSTSCVNLASTASGGLVEISSTGDTDTNANNLLFIKN